MDEVKVALEPGLKHYLSDHSHVSYEMGMEYIREFFPELESAVRKIMSIAGYVPGEGWKNCPAGAFDIPSRRPA